MTRPATLIDAQGRVVPPLHREKGEAEKLDGKALPRIKARDDTRTMLRMLRDKQGGILDRFCNRESILRLTAAIRRTFESGGYVVDQEAAEAIYEAMCEQLPTAREAFEDEEWSRLHVAGPRPVMHPTRRPRLTRGS